MAVRCKGAHFPKKIMLMGVRWSVAYPPGREALLLPQFRCELSRGRRARMRNASTVPSTAEPRPHRPCRKTGFEEAGLTYRVINSMAPRIVW